VRNNFHFPLKIREAEKEKEKASLLILFAPGKGFQSKKEEKTIAGP